MTAHGTFMRDPTRLLAGFFFVSAIGAALLAPQAAGARETVSFKEGSAGTIVIKTNERRLYYVLGGGQAIRYPVGVGRAGKQWAGTAFIDGMRLKPAWSPPADVRRDKPSLPAVIPGGTPGNPMGAAALTLSGGQYAIHGTNAPGSVGGFVSYGCIRMYNADIMDLYQRVHFGTPVTVTR
jgi:lipoprotein-anchoring transpeptidase ErfK/SrfK